MAKRSPARSRPPSTAGSALDVEDALVSLVRAGDAEASRCLSNACEPWLRRRAERHLPLAVRRRVGVSDVVQDALAAALLGLDRFESRGPDAFQRWVGRILDHKVRDALRTHARRRRRGEREAPAGAEARIAASTPTPSVVALGAEARRALAGARSRLPAAEQEVVRLLDDASLPPAEAARRMGRSADAVRRLHARAIARLRAWLDPKAAAPLRATPEAAPSGLRELGSLVGRRLGPWLVTRSLGAGATSSVVEARAVARTPHGPAGKSVALKVFAPRVLARRGALARFRAEAAIGRRVRHENVVRLLGSGSARHGRARLRFLVCELVPGRSLRAWLDEDGPVGESLALHVARQVARGLAAIHAAGGVHRDVKPENVLVTPDQRVRLVDLGFAGPPERPGAARGFDGSFAYAAPEQWAQGAARTDGRADLYALGLVLQEIATGRHPFGERADVARLVGRRLEADPPAPSSVEPRLSARFDAIVQALLQRDPDARPPSAAAFLEWLDGHPGGWCPRAPDAKRFDTPAWDLGPAPRPLRGREEELASLAQAIAEAREGRGTALLLTGEAGIGKTRLAAEAAVLLRSAHPRARLLRGTAAWHEPPADPVAGALRTALGDALGDLLLVANPDAPALARAYEAWARGREGPGGQPSLSAGARTAVVARALAILAGEAPVLVVLEDLHDASESALAGAHALVRSVRALPVVVVLTARRVGSGGAWTALAADASVGRVALTALPRPAIEAIVRDHAPAGAERPMDPATVARAGGNPFVAIELARAGALGRRDGAEPTVPETLRRLVLERIQRLDDGERDALSAASCEGEEFDPALVGEALGLGPVEALRRFSGLHREHGVLRAEGERFRFEHPALAETIAASLPPPLARAYHAALARALERQASSGGGARKRPARPGLLPALARHRFASGGTAAGWHVVEEALRALYRQHAHAQLLRLADDALATRAPNDKQRLHVLWRAVDACRLLGRSDVERARLDEAMEVAERLGDLESRLITRRGLAWHLLRRGDPHRAHELLVEARALATASGSLAHELDCDVHLGNVDLVSGRAEQALARYRSCASRARAARLRGPELYGVLNTTSALMSLNRFEEALAEARRAMALIPSAAFELAPTARGNLAACLAFLGHLREAERELRWALARAVELGDVRDAAGAACNLSTLAREDGRLADALAFAARALDDARFASDEQRIARGLLRLAEARRLVGDVDAALRALEEARASRGCSADPRERAWATHALGLTHAQRGEREAACRSLENALAAHRQASDARGIGEACAALAALRLGLPTHVGGDPAPTGPVEQARPLLLEAVACARAIGSPARLATALAATCLLPEADVASIRAEVRGLGRRVPRLSRMEARWLLWRAAGRAGDLAAARRDLAFVETHAPPERHAALRSRTPLFRAIAEGWR